MKVLIAIVLLVTASSAHADEKSAASDQRTAANISADDNAFDLEAGRTRRKLENEMNGAAQSLQESKAALDQIDRHAPDYRTWTKTDIDAHWAERRKFLNKESESRIKLVRSQAAFTSLTESVRHHYGRLPSTWRAEPNCQACP